MAKQPQRYCCENISPTLKDIKNSNKNGKSFTRDGIVYEHVGDDLLFNTYNYSSSYDEFRNKYSDELSAFIKEGLLYHANPDSDGAYIRFSVSQKGFETFKFIDHIA